jgi:hypothetical protein
VNQSGDEGGFAGTEVPGNGDEVTRREDSRESGAECAGVVGVLSVKGARGHGPEGCKK